MDQQEHHDQIDHQETTPAAESESPSQDMEITTELSPEMTPGGHDQVSGKKFGTFSGVFRPTIVTILGVMMYLREGWVVGNAGLGGALLIILMAYVITGTTALSLSSITSNIRLGAGGIFAIATQSLGLEVGGSIGIPFYLAQGLSTAMYIYGFMEGWIYIFPTHHPLLVVFAIFSLVFLVSYLSTSLAFKVQILVMTGVIIALGSMLGSLGVQENFQQPQLIGEFADADLWALFAVFFPASTGIMVGASMSGSLKNPRLSIPIGTMSAWGLSLAVYVSLAIWYSLVATPAELTGQLTIAVEKSLWGPGVLIGILSSCFTAALSSFVASPRTLQALAEHRIVPLANFFGKTKNAEPRNAILFTGGMIFFVLLLGDLNAIAKLVTIFFLMTYFTVNFILLIEKKLNLISFRPTFRIPIIVPFLGSFSALAAILIVSPFWGFACILISIFIYIYLDRRSLDNPFETLNSGLFISLANWAARQVTMDTNNQNLRSWKPDILYPIERTTQLEGNFRFLLSLVSPQGSVQAIGMLTSPNSRKLGGLESIIQEMREEGIFASCTIVETTDYATSLRTTAAVTRSSFFKPNILFSQIEDRKQDELNEMLKIAADNKMGLLLFARHPDTGLGKSRQINLWIRDQSPNWHLSFHMANIDLPLLIALMLVCNAGMKLRVLCLVSEAENVAPAQEYLKDLMILARMPAGYQLQVENAGFQDFVGNAPRADLNIFGLSAKIADKKFMLEMVQENDSSCLFIRNSGGESILV